MQYGQSRWRALTIASVIIIVFIGAFSQCEVQKHAASKQGSGSVTDRDGNIYLIRKMPDGKYWMTENLKLNVPASYCYDGLQENCDEYGRLYTWESAGKGCRQLGNGWHLPTDNEWRHMSKYYGGVREGSVSDGRDAYGALLKGGRSRFNAVLGGGRDPEGTFQRINAHGFYWTATRNDSATAIFYNFGKGSLMLNRHPEGEKTRAFCVRCVKE